jgi:hypothetical protein
MPAASISNRITAMIRRGAAIASNAIRCSTSRPPCVRGRKISGNAFFFSINTDYERRLRSVHPRPDIEPDQAGNSAIDCTLVRDVTVGYREATPEVTERN